MSSSKQGRRPSSEGKRIRGRRLQEIRRLHFAMHPLCVHCLERGVLKPATQLDHRIALTNGGEDVEENRQGLCDDCHSKKTAQDMGYAERPEIGLDGWPVD